ncbi:family 16 glycoside hydrolase [Edaphobacter dinghuensis]|uniref:FHA domain-containing protein n=1 Tax=Edaphobacter dinghuensis TaxID=1560005 RepID=A0A917LZP4_9BACT|nr:family 16 glycoside hydrolase [Edaphobacter dinghuensis]GGG67883.1 hypothetical protein GCM10011585_07260 [Edaphobacter dinghuensis]
MSVNKIVKKILWSGVALVLLPGLAITAQAQNKLTAAEAYSGWLNLFDGASTNGWDSTSGWTTQQQSLSTSMAADRRIVTALPFADFILNFEFRSNATPSGAAVRIRVPHSGEPEGSGYWITLGDSKPDWPAGSVVLKSKSSLSTPALNVWHKVSIEANGSHIVVQIDGQRTAETTDDSAKAGYIQFQTARGAGLDLRNIYVKPLNVNSVFNNVDLSGWKNIPFTPKPGEGVGHSLAKMFSFGSGGKSHTANWSVKGGKIHGESGPGSLETTGSYDDFVLQITGSAQVEEKKKDAFPAIYFRNEAGSIATGYPLGIGNKSGELRGLARPLKPLATQPAMSETVVAGGRVIGIFINGSLTTLYTDTRPESATTKTGARVKTGTISLDMPEDVKSIDVSNVAVESIPNSFGGVVHAAVPKPVPSAATSEVSAPAQSASIAAQTAQIAAALGTPTPQARQQVAQLMSEALKTDDPQQQMQLYDQVVRIDPNNAAAVQGYKEAAAKAAAQQQQQQQQQNQAQQQEVSASQRDRQVSDSLAAAQSAFLSGDLKHADKLLSVAERLAPENPLARDLRSRIDAAFSLRHRLVYLASGAGILALFGVGGLFWRSRRRVRFPVLQIVQGLDQGRLYPVDRDVVRIGGIAQDGAQKNDIVIRDVEHMISRFHCEVRKKDGHFFLIDTNSSNGTKVNGEPARPSQPIALRKGSKIDLGGSTVLRFDFEKKKRQT